MPQIGKFIGQNVLAFKQLEVDFNQKGLNLIIGRNLDDVKGNDSRNGVGKSSLFKALEGHIFPSGSGLKASEIVNDEVGKDYLTICQWQPANSLTHYSYQYYKHGDWGGGANIYKGGTYEDYEAGVEGVEDVSYDDSRDSARAVSEFFGLSFDEWTLLGSLIDIGNDDVHPFFCSNRAGRLELVQNLYGLNYSQINYYNKEEMKIVRKEAERIGITIQSSLKLLDDQLAQLPAKEELEVITAVEGKAVTKLEKQLNTANSQLDRVKEMRSTWDRYNELHAKLTKAGVAQRQVDSEIEASRTVVEGLQSQLELAGSKRTALSLYLDKQRQVAELSDQLAVAAGGIQITDLDQLLAQKNEQVAHLGRVVNYVSGSHSDYAKVKSRLSPIDKPGAALAILREQLLAEIANLPSLEAAQAAATNLHVRYREAEAQLSNAADLQATLAQLSAVGYMEYAAFFQDRDHLFNLINQLKIALGQFPQNLKTLQEELRTINAALDGTATCPTCKQSWCTHTPEDLAAYSARKPICQQEIADIEAAQAKATTDLQAMEYLSGLLQGNGGDLYWRYRAGTYVMGNYDLASINAELAAANETYTLLTNQHTELNDLLKAVDRILAAIPAEFLDCLENDYQHYSGQVQTVNDEISTLRSIKVIDGQLQQARIALDAAAQNEYVLAESDPARALSELEQYIASSTVTLSENQQFIRSMTPYLADWLEYKSDRFANIQELAATMATQDLEGLQATHADLSTKLNSARAKLNDATAQLSQRKDLERRRQEIEAQATEVNALESKLRVQKAIDLLSGPRGLMVSRTEALFERINLLLNQYLAVLVQDGISKGRPLTAWLEMSNQTVDLNVYKGDTFKAKKLLSASEKARVKLALTLAMREVAPRNKLPNVLLLDEIDGSSCETNQSRIWDCIQMYLERNPDTSVWAVSHSPSVQQSGVWNNVYEIIKNNGEATIRLRD